LQPFERQFGESVGGLSLRKVEEGRALSTQCLRIVGVDDTLPVEVYAVDEKVLAVRHLCQADSLWTGSRVEILTR
jgi:hypothetical protein